jgi:hypothetical protein
MIDLNEVDEVVTTLRDEVYQTSGCCEYFNLFGQFADGEIFIEFLGINIWNTVDDDREYIDEDNDIRVPLEDHLRKRINEEIAKVSKIKL